MNFQINVYLRFALIALFLIGGVALIFVKGYGFWYGFPLFLIGAVLLAGYILLGTTQSAAMMMQTGGGSDAVRERLKLTFFPQWLYKPIRAQYHLLLGTLAGQDKDYEKAEAHFSDAQKAGLSSDDEKAMVLLSLANFRLMKKNWAAAENYLRQVKTLNVTMPQIKEQIVEFDKAMKQRGQAEAMMRPGMMNGFRPSSKRTRPKSR